MPLVRRVGRGPTRNVRPRCSWGSPSVGGVIRASTQTGVAARGVAPHGIPRVARVGSTSTGGGSSDGGSGSGSGSRHCQGRTVHGPAIVRHSGVRRGHAGPCPRPVWRCAICSTREHGADASRAGHSCGGVNGCSGDPSSRNTNSRGSGHGSHSAGGGSGGDRCGHCRRGAAGRGRSLTRGRCLAGSERVIRAVGIRRGWHRGMSCWGGWCTQRCRC